MLSLKLEKQTSKNVVVSTFIVFIIVVNNLLFTRPFQFENAPSGSLILQLVDHIQDSFEKPNAKVDIRYSYYQSIVLKVIFFPQTLMHFSVSKM